MVSRDSIVDDDWLRASGSCHRYDAMIRSCANGEKIWLGCSYGAYTAEGK